MNNIVNITIEAVDKKLVDLFKKRLDIDINTENKNTLLMGREIGLSARDLIYICLDIEKEFGVLIDDYCIENYSLTTFENIKGFILSSVNCA